MKDNKTTKRKIKNIEKKIKKDNLGYAQIVALLKKRGIPFHLGLQGRWVGIKEIDGYKVFEDLCPSKEVLSDRAIYAIRRISFGEPLGLTGEFLYLYIEERIKRKKFNAGVRVGEIVTQNRVEYGTMHCQWCYEVFVPEPGTDWQCASCGGS